MIFHVPMDCIFRYNRITGMISLSYRKELVKKASKQDRGTYFESFFENEKDFQCTYGLQFHEGP